MNPVVVYTAALSMPAGAMWFTLLYSLPSTAGLFRTIRRNFASCLLSKQMLAFIGGGAVLGMGMTICGSVSFDVYNNNYFLAQKL